MHRIGTARCSRAVRQFVVVFDVAGKTNTVQRGRCQGQVTVLFAAPDADTYLQTVMRQSRTPRQLLVVSDDRAIRDTAKACGVERMTARQFLATLAPVTSDPRTPAGTRLSPDQARSITEELRRHWGV